MDKSIPEQLSKSERKRRHLALQALGETLSRLRPAEIAALPLNEQLRDAVVEASRLERAAWRRQLRYVAQILAQQDNTALLAAVDELRGDGVQATARQHRLEHWRERLIAEGDAALGALLTQYPDANRTELRALVRQARRERSQGGTPRAARALFRSLRVLDSGANPASSKSIGYADTTEAGDRPNGDSDVDGRQNESQ